MTAPKLTEAIETIKARLAFIAGCQAEQCCNACRKMAADTLALLRAAAAEPEAHCAGFPVGMGCPKCEAEPEALPSMLAVPGLEVCRTCAGNGIVSRGPEHEPDECPTCGPGCYR